MVFYVVFGRVAKNNSFKPVFVIPECGIEEKIEDKINTSIKLLTEVNIGGFYNKYITKKFEISEDKLKDDNYVI